MQIGASPKPRTLEEFRRDHGLDLNDAPAEGSQSATASASPEVDVTSRLNIQA